MSPFEIPEGPYTIEQVMEAIRAQVIDGPAAPPPKLDEAAGEPARETPQAIVTDGSSSSRLLAQLELMRQRHGLEVNYRPRSHRRAIGWVFNLVKRFIQWGSRPYADAIRLRQEAFNETVLQALREVSLQLGIAEQIKQDHWGRIVDLCDQLENYKIPLEALQQRQDQFGGMLEEQSRKLTGQAEWLNEFSGMLDEQSGRLSGQAERLSGQAERLNGQAERLKELGGMLEEQSGTLSTLAGQIKALHGRHDLAPLYESVSAERRLALMDLNRGPFKDIASRQSSYVWMFRDRPGRILDLGCGRGELLQLLRQEGIECWGAEIDPLMVAEVRKLGAHAVEMDALSALRSVPPASLGGLFAAQLIEHLFPGEIVALLKLAREKIAPGGCIVLETLNPASLGVMAKSYYRDLEHKQPIHPEYLKLLLAMVGFEQVSLQYLAPFNEDERLPDLPAEIGLTGQARQVFQEQIRRLNNILFGMQDYYVMGRQGAAAPGDEKDAAGS